MLKITCNNRVCGTNFFFDERKNPKATKVMCPKCKAVQPLQSGSIAPEKEEEEDYDWIKGNDKPIYSAPVIAPIEDIKEVNNEPSENFYQKQQPKKEPAPIPQIPQRKPIESPDTIGWLVIHDEYTDTYTFNLRPGINRIGRDSDSTALDVNIRIKTKDGYMSRHHCDIEVRWQNGRNEYMLSDKAYQGKKASSNGTFVNAGRQLSVRDEVRLQDGDTIQVGRTKLVLKLPSAVGSSKDAESWVKEMDYFKTIIQ